MSVSFALVPACCRAASPSRGILWVARFLLNFVDRPRAKTTSRRSRKCCARRLIVPSVAGHRSSETAALLLGGRGTAKLTSTPPALHEARGSHLLFRARPARGVAGAARLLWGEGAAGAVAAALRRDHLGPSGHAQRIAVDVALMAGFAVALLRIPAGHSRRRWGGAVLGHRMGLGFRGRGLYAPAG